MPKLYDKDTGAWLGTITEEQLQFLIDQLEDSNSRPPINNIIIQVVVI